DSAGPRIAQNVQQKLHEFGGKIWSHPIYSSDIALSYYHPFRASVRNNIETYFNERPRNFYSDGVIALLKR
ncbi:hypothetical protein WH47_11999, partial [Habropoda laboriosa]